MTETEQARVLARVKKMLTLANDAGASEGERDNAMRMAHATLAKYNLDLAQIEATTKTANADEPRTESSGVFNGYPWARHVCQSVAELFFCNYIYAQGRGLERVQHYFIGRKSNAITAALLAEFLVKAIHREGNRQARELIEGSGWARNFMLGAAQRVRERVRELRAATKAQTAAPTSGAPGTALVLASLYQTEAAANALHLAQRFPMARTVTSRSKGVSDGTAHSQGRAYGGTVSLTPQIR